MNNRKILVAIPEQQHSYELVSSLNRNGFEVTYITTTYFKNNSKLLKLIKFTCPESVYLRASKRRCSGIKDNQVKVFYPILGLVQLFAMRISLKLYRKIRKFKWYLFERKIVKYVNKNNFDILIVYEDYCSYILDELSNSNVVKIVDCSAAAKLYMKKIYEEDSMGMVLPEIMAEYPVLWEKKTDFYSVNKADCLLVPSEFSKKSYLYQGIPENKIFKVPYPLSLSSSIRYESKIKGKFKFIYSGQVTYRKGIHHLLKCFTDLKMMDIELHLFGDYNKESKLYIDYCSNENIYFHGWTEKEALLDWVSNCDVFVFPSLSDSMSFSCLEAISLGTPVICSDNTGASEFIINDETGFVVESGNEEDLKEAMLWCINNRMLLPDIGMKASLSIKDVVGKKNYDYLLKNLIDNY